MKHFRQGTNTCRKGGKMTKEQEITKNMEILKISRKEAEELYRSDHEEIDTPEQIEYTAKAKKIKRYEKSNTPRKKTSKERKIDEEKKRLLNDYRVITEGLGAVITSIKNEAEFSFIFNENSYTVKLIKHRPVK